MEDNVIPPLIFFGGVGVILFYFDFVGAGLIACGVGGFFSWLSFRDRESSRLKAKANQYSKLVFHAEIYANKLSSLDVKNTPYEEEALEFICLVKKIPIGAQRIQYESGGEHYATSTPVRRPHTSEEVKNTISQAKTLISFLKDKTQHVEKVPADRMTYYDTEEFNLLVAFQAQIERKILDQATLNHGIVNIGKVIKDDHTSGFYQGIIAGSLHKSDRFKHQYVLGKTGSGKSVLLRHQLTQDIHNGDGIVLMTPERGLIDDVLRYIPEERKNDVVFINPADDTNPVIGFNPFVIDKSENLVQKAGELETIFVRSLGEMGVSMRPMVSNTIYAIIQGGLSISDFPKLIDPFDNSHRHALLARGVLDERTADFFVKYDKSSYYKKSYEPIVNRLDALLRPPLVNVLTTSALDFPNLLNRKKSIVLCNLSSLRGSQAEVVGQLLLATFQQVFFQRDQIEEKYRIPYFFYMDEFQTYATANQQSLKDFLTRARKYKVGICMAHQNIGDIPTELSASIFGNCGTLVGMLMSANDASRFKKEAQLKNFDDLEDKHGARAGIQLQNFDPGMCAITTPKNKKAFIARVPEHPVFEKREQIDELVQLSKQNYGVAMKRKEQPNATPNQKGNEHAEKEPAQQTQKQSNNLDDDFEFEIS